jgi:murein DD-endopeptidase MepM/ murein hydrolase activator NlpD
MQILRFLRVVCLAVVAPLPIAWVQFGADPFVDLIRYTTGSPHDRHAVELTWGRRGATSAAKEWLADSERALDTAVPVALKRGQRFVVQGPPAGAGTTVFVDLFERTATGFRRAAYAPAGSTTLVYEADRDGTFVVRVQPPLDSPVESVDVDTRIEPTLRLPVKDASPRSIGSVYGDPRDAGRRDHHGIDIFAKRGTPVIAAAGGIVTRVGTNGLGGKVVWISRPFHGESHYYAHLDEQLVTVGTRVEEGDVIGLVGNTGNARSTPPHLHFGIYTAGGAVDPLPYVAS